MPVLLLATDLPVVLTHLDAGLRVSPDIASVAATDCKILGYRGRPYVSVPDQLEGANVCGHGAPDARLHHQSIALAHVGKPSLLRNAVISLMAS
jgi:hypothetical protein